MSTSTIQKLRTIFFFTLLSIAFHANAQQTYKVVCDKTDHQVKIVEAENHSANYVTIKTGFPFRQVAQKWIDDNYTTTQCDPEDIIKQTNTASQPATATQNTAGSIPVTSSGQAPKRTFLQARKNSSGQKFRNTSFFMSGRFSNLGEAFSLEEKLMFGAGAGFELFFGGSLYLGTGIHMDFYFSPMDGRFDEKSEMFYHFRIPAFIGYRTYTPKLVVMYEAGIGFNTNLNGTPLTIESYGLSAESNSFNFLGRLKVGSEKVMFMMGADIWLSQMLSTTDYKMTSLNAGFCFFF